MDAPYYRTWLAAELARRQARNKRYSLRAFAKDARLNAGTLSSVLAGKQALSLKAAQRLVEALAIPAREGRRLLESVVRDQSSTGIRRVRAMAPTPADTSRELDPSVYDDIADWVHYAVLELAQVDGFDPSPRWIGEALGVSPFVARAALQRLVRLGLLKKSGATYTRVSQHVTNKNKHTLSTAAIRKHLRQVFEKAIVALDDSPVEQRSMQALTLPCAPDRLPEAKAAIEAFINDFAVSMTTGAKTSVYELVVGFYPLMQPKPVVRKDTPA
jgi:uncharacterized protein (TIGR02147 family)